MLLLWMKYLFDDVRFSFVCFQDRQSIFYYILECIACIFLNVQKCYLYF